MKWIGRLQQARRPGLRAIYLVTLAAAVLLPLAVSAAGSAGHAARIGASSNDPPLYAVEMVVFRAATPGAGEDWNTLPPGRGFGSATSRGGEAPMLVRVLSVSDYRLDGVVYGLRASGAWRTVAHAAWVQTAPPWGTHVGVALSQIGVNVPGLSGTVYLERAPIYLHLGVDISLQAGSAAETYTINEMRNVRQNEKQYFDHPAFGIIAVVTQIKQAGNTPGTR